ALNRGAEVTVILGKHSVAIDSRANVVDVVTTQDMYDQTISRVADHDIIIMAGAPCDYRPEVFSESKIKTENLTIKFVKNPDIAQKVGQIKGDKFLCVFSAETDNGLANATAKLIKKNANLCVLNDVKNNDVFGSDTNVVTLVTADGHTDYPKLSKTEVANIILNKAIGK
ncbi:MAG: bifunctional 4'-phosphopantothenoylcysteine decarboxylase/phosphopantothenoylcysteine synthetase, partial [Clostridia bacterium]|nr:bifunctional 4'-phosphopantothenoylcysteine decarboxylase/phosphopantothenoylcysteine synthetase [Clostridia bacterium]